MVDREAIALLTQSARDFLTRRAPANRIRQLRADDMGWDKALWQQMSDLGWGGVAVPEENGGVELGFGAQCALLEEAGRQLVPEPLLTNAISARILMESKKDATGPWLEGLASGLKVVAFAVEEPDARFHRLSSISARVERGTLRGLKHHVPHGYGADAFLVTAHDEIGPGLFLVERSYDHMAWSRQYRVDGRNAARVLFDGAPAIRLGGASAVWNAYEIAAVALASEQLGAAERAFELTLDYLKTRTQFGQTIGTFQALQHRAARIFIELSLLKSAVRGAARAVDENPAELPPLASLAKALADDTSRLVTNEGVQMHGGIGVTDEHDIGLYLKRARVAAVAFGDAPYHRRLWASLRGF